MANGDDRSRHGAQAGQTPESKPETTESQDMAEQQEFPILRV